MEEEVRPCKDRKVACKPCLDTVDGGVVCGQCSVCECDCDGQLPKDKTNRKRGAHGLIRARTVNNEGEIDAIEIDATRKRMRITPIVSAIDITIYFFSLPFNFAIPPLSLSLFILTLHCTRHSSYTFTSKDYSESRTDSRFNEIVTVEPERKGHCSVFHDVFVTLGLGSCNAYKKYKKALLDASKDKSPASRAELEAATNSLLKKISDKTCSLVAHDYCCHGLEPSSSAAEDSDVEMNGEEEDEERDTNYNVISKEVKDSFALHLSGQSAQGLQRVIEWGESHYRLPAYNHAMFLYVTPFVEQTQTNCYHLIHHFVFHQTRNSPQEEVTLTLRRK